MCEELFPAAHVGHDDDGPGSDSATAHARLRYCLRATPLLPTHSSVLTERAPLYQNVMLNTKCWLKHMALNHTTGLDQVGTFRSVLGTV